MTEYEWETRHTLRRPEVGLWGGYVPRVDAVSQYAALEYPREHVAWLLNPLAGKDGKASPPNGPREPRRFWVLKPKEEL